MCHISNPGFNMSWGCVKWSSKFCINLTLEFSSYNLTVAERIFHYRLSQAIRVVENAIGILANRFLCLLTTLQLCPENIQSVVLACVCLHNLMRIRYPGQQNVALDWEVDDHQVIRGALRDEGLPQDVRDVTGPNAATREAKKQRVYLKHYYNDIWAVPWQRDMI